jgi:hypothetical protein
MIGFPFHICSYYTSDCSFRQSLQVYTVPIPSIVRVVTLLISSLPSGACPPALVVRAQWKYPSTNSRKLPKRGPVTRHATNTGDGSSEKE